MGKVTTLFRQDSQISSSYHLLAVRCCLCTILEDFNEPRTQNSVLSCTTDTRYQYGCGLMLYVPVHLPYALNLFLSRYIFYSPEISFSNYMADINLCNIHIYTQHNRLITDCLNVL